MGGVLDLDHYVDNLLARIEALERRLEDIERAAATGLFDGTTMKPPGGVSFESFTKTLDVTDADDAGATEQAWIEVAVGGTTGYVRVYASK